MTMTRIVTLIAAAAAAAALAAVPASAQLADTTVTLGLAASKTGAAATYGASQVRGAQLAVRDLNAKRTLGFTLALATRDDRSTAAGAKAALEGLIADEAAALLGPTLSAAALVADPVVQKADRPLVAISNTADGITAIGSNIFRVSLTEREQIPAAVRAATRRLRFERPVVITRADQPFAVAGAKAFRSALRAAGAPVRAEATYTGAPRSFASYLRKLAAARPDALVINSLTEGPQLLKQARALAAFADVPILGGNAFNSPAVVKAAGEAADGLIVGAAWSPELSTAASRAFVSAYRKRYGSRPDQFAAQAYTGVLVAARAIAAADSTDPAAIRSQLRKLRLGTPLGTLRFGADRGAIVPGVVQIVSGGSFKLLR